MNNQKELTAAIKNICNSALSGKLSIDRFYELWPDNASGSPFFRKVYEDIEDAVQHFPGTWLSGKPLYEQWVTSNMYFIIYLDCILLGYDKKHDELAQCRKYVLEQETLSERIIEDGVMEYFRR